MLAPHLSCLPFSCLPSPSLPHPSPKSLFLILIIQPVPFARRPGRAADAAASPANGDATLAAGEMKERPAAEVALSRWQGLPWLFCTWERAAQRCRQPPRVMQHDKPPVLLQPWGDQQGGGRGGSRLILPPCVLPSHASRSLLRGKGLARGRQGMRQLGAAHTP